MKAIKAFRLALATLTVLPIRFRDGEISEADLASSRYAYPAVGLLIGSLLAGLAEALTWWQTAPTILTFFLLLFWVALTGGLHLDGLADTTDGLFLSGGAERRLAVLRDPHVGSFGATALGLLLLGKFAALTTLGGHDRSLALIGCSVVGRSVVLVAAGLAPYARSEGTGRIVVEATTWRDAAGTTLLSFAAGSLFLGLRGLTAGLVAIILAGGLAYLAAKRLGGVTGDVLGAVVELGELGFLLTCGLTVSRA